MKELEIIDYFYKKLSEYTMLYCMKEFKIKDLRIDIFAIGKDKIPYIIEIKKHKNRYIAGQASQNFSLVSANTKTIEKEIGFSNVNWCELKVLCFAPDFYERENIIYNSEPLKGKVHFYKYDLIQIKTEILLDFEYLGPEKHAPLKINQIDNKNRIIEMRNKYFNYKDNNHRNYYYLNKIVPVFEDLKEQFVEYEKAGIYVHWYRTKDAINEINVIRIFLSLNKVETELTLSTSIFIDFFEDEVLFGLEFRSSSINEASKFDNYLKNSSTQSVFIKDILRFKEYSIYFPNTSSEYPIPIKLLNKKRIIEMIDKYDPHEKYEYSFCIVKLYDKEEMFENDIKKILINGYKQFNCILDSIT